MLILADDLGWNDVSLHGGVAGGSVPTPHIDALARAGVRFTNGYAGNAVCAPSRAMLLTGRYSTRFGFEFTPTPKGMGLMIELFFERPRRAAASAASTATLARAHARHVRARHAAARRSRSRSCCARAATTRCTSASGTSADAPEFAPTRQGFDESLEMEGGKYLPEDDPNVVNSKQDFDPIDAFLWPNTRYAVSFERRRALRAARAT